MADNRTWGTTLLCALIVTACAGQPAAQRTAVVALVQVENGPDSDPHSGLQSADAVYEYLAEGGITRFTVVYFDPGRVGKIEPVRSVRSVALRLREAYGGVLFFSGGSQPMVQRVESEHVPFVSNEQGGSQYFHRDSERSAPSNLYTTGSEVRDAVSRASATSRFTLPAPGSLSLKGAAATKVLVQQTSGHTVTYSYSGTGQSYSYASERGPLIDAGNGSQPVKIKNVVVLQVTHRDLGFAEDVNGAPSIDFDLSTGGSAELISAGSIYDVKWRPFAAGSGLSLVASDGSQLSLPGGLTWINLVDPGVTATSS